MNARILLILLTFIFFFQMVHAQWEKLEVPVNTTLHEMNFWNDGTGVVIGPWNVVRTEDGGQSWTVIETPDLNFATSFSFPDPDTGYALDGWNFLKTVDGGNSWITYPVAKGSRAQVLNSIGMRNAWQGYVVGFWISQGGLTGEVVYCTNNGMNWSGCSLPQVGSGLWQKIRFTDDLKGYAYTIDTVLVYTYDGGNQWHSAVLSIDNLLRDVCLLDDTTVIAVASEVLEGNTVRTVLRKDAGQNDFLKIYEDTLPGYTRSFRRAWFEDQMNGWIIGTDGLISRTYDVGYTWEEAETGTDQDLLGCYFEDIDNGYVVGGGGTILKLGDPSGVESQSISSKHKIQVYPNPCNEKVFIELKDLVPGSYSLKIFDLTGRVLFSSSGVNDKSGHVISIGTASFPRGLFVVNIENEGSRTATKFSVVN